MKIISISTDRNIFEENSTVRKRMIEYGEMFDELHIVVFTTRFVNYKSQIALPNNVFVYATNSRNRAFYIIDALKISKTIIHNSYPIIHNFVISCQDPFETGMVGALLKLFFNLPLHIQVHTDFANKYFRRVSLLNKIRFFMAEFILKYSDRVRVVSERIKKSIEKFSENIDVLPIKVEILQIEPPKNFPKVSPWEILAVCRLEKEKNLITAIRAFKIVSDEFSEISFVIVGDGSERKNLEKLRDNLRLKDKVIFAGWQNNPNNYYQNANIYISTSLYEGYGISIMEAAYFGIPLILSDTGLAGDIFRNGDSAFICDATDLKCFAQNILKLYSNKNLTKQMGQRAKEKAGQHLNLNKNYFEEYANSINKTAVGFKVERFFERIFHFKRIFFNSFIYLRYFICGIVAAVTNIFLLYALTEFWGVWYLYSSILAFSFALILSFILQKFVVFKDAEIKGIHRQFWKFFIVAVLGVTTNTVLISILVEVFGVWYILSQVVAGFFVMIQNFVMYRFFIFNR